MNRSSRRLQEKWDFIFPYMQRHREDVHASNKATFHYFMNDGPIWYASYPGNELERYVLPVKLSTSYTCNFEFHCWPEKNWSILVCEKRPCCPFRKPGWRQSSKSCKQWPVLHFATDADLFQVSNCSKLLIKVNYAHPRFAFLWRILFFLSCSRNDFIHNKLVRYNWSALYVILPIEQLGNINATVGMGDNYFYLMLYCSRIFHVVFSNINAL